MRTFLFSIFFIASTFSNAQTDFSIAKNPIIFIHGFLASGDTWANAFDFFQLEGYNTNQLFVFDWNSISGNNQQTDTLLSKFIDEVLKKTGASQVELVAHSAGGGLARNLLKDSIQANKVAHYAHIGSRKWTTAYPWFPNAKCINIFSTGDKVAGNAAGRIEGATNLAFGLLDHYQVATSHESLQAIKDFFAGQYILCFENSNPPVEIAGKAVELGTNQPMRGATLTIYPLNIKNGKRKRALLADRLAVDENGNWGPVTIERATPYEIEVIPANRLGRVISYYFPPFSQSNPLVYLRGFPNDSRMNFLLGKIPENETNTTLVLYASTSAMVGGRDSVTVNGMQICSPLLTPASKTAITSFIFDDGDGVSSGKALKQFSSVPFISGVDIALAADKKPIYIYCNGQQLTIPALPSAQRIQLAVFR
ncbi:MAG: alpha/beta fold hydrolase [Chitinophagia bacterium]|nr:alpha/beta fold hydrolase [Chitinophagia bacterium]